MLAASARNTFLYDCRRQASMPRARFATGFFELAGRGMARAIASSCRGRLARPYGAVSAALTAKTEGGTPSGRAGETPATRNRPSLSEDAIALGEWQPAQHLRL